MLLTDWRMIMHTHIRELAYCGCCTALLAVCSWISIPFPIPFTLQTFAVFLLGRLLGGRNATLCVCCYLLCGAIGLPVFSGFRGGISAMFDLTGGYLLGFLLSTLLLWLTERWWSKSRPRFLLCAIAALLICYMFGTLWFLFLSMNSHDPLSIAAILGVCVVPFIIPDMIKILMADMLGRRLRHLLHLDAE